MPTTIADIAREAGVSTMSVSRAINDDPKISPATRERILRVARKLNYRPNRYARALRTNLSHMIGIVIPDLMHSFFAEISMGVEAFSRPAGYKNFICNTEEDSGVEAGEVEALLTHTDGLIVATALPPAETKFYRRLIKGGARIVLIDRQLDGLRCPVIKTDDVLAGTLGTEHLIKLGHRRIGHLYGPGTSNAVGRLEGYRRALKKHQLPFTASLVRGCVYPYERSGYEVMSAWIREGNAPTALFTFNDPTAIGALRAVFDAGLRVPDDVAFVGCGAIQYGDLLRVPLTTVSWSPAEMGRAAAHQLVEMIKGKRGEADGARQTIFTPELVVRESCGAASGVRLRSGSDVFAALKTG
ncbi:MAG: LacI family DNA-binding transcriptional regulator [Rubrivivax sp.]|nr:LacI family DNA-binding transcriptional regulator [Pyrinomonadaceae bacterium]